MATEVRETNNGFLYFIVGALIVGVIVLGFLFYNGNLGGQRSSTDAAIERSADAIGDAADKIGDSAGDAARSANPPGGG
ncbi:MAG TPA: hypothetical protein VFV70_16380 [Hyphomonadaceae bacterium]|nr:hypothetical protein [Hyphomonadaceae bacterium]